MNLHSAFKDEYDLGVGGGLVERARGKYSIHKCLLVEMNMIEAGENMTRKTCDDVPGRL